MTTLTANQLWNKNYSEGIEVELKVAAYLESRGWTILEHAEGLHPEYDLKVMNEAGQIHTIEVKSDHTRYYNASIEFFHNNKPSGISTSRADWYIYYYTQTKELFMVRRSRLLESFMKDPEMWTYKPVRNSKYETFTYIISKYNLKQFATYRKVEL